VSDATFHLFIYGTLRASGSAAQLLGGSRFVAVGSVTGTLYDIRGEFPALMLYGDTRIAGEIWRCRSHLLARLDEYEDVGGGLFRRVGTRVAGYACWTYVAGPRLAHELTLARRIASGVWSAARPAEIGT
jgi:gamma-glutamylcyclotransferase (GGCT)/AIG2-like uncharacterized protein YtfP